MSTKLADLKPEAAAAAARAIADLKARGVPHVVTYTLRTYAEQAALYAKGRQPLAVVNCLMHDAGLPSISEGENNIVTQCDGKRIAEGGKGRSPHQLGTALDVVPLGENGPIWPAPGDPRWKQIAQSFKEQGFEWGGDWPDFPDYPHYQLKA